MAVLLLETLVYFGFKFASECMGWCSGAEPEEEEPSVPAKAVDISAMADTYVMPTNLKLPKSSRSLPKHTYLQDDWMLEVTVFGPGIHANPPSQKQKKKIPRAYQPQYQ
jgi:hypothetical protein